MRAWLSTLLILSGLATTAAVADEDGVYESLANIPIGRVFLTAQERASLDRIRGQAPIAPASVQPTRDAPEPVPDIDPAGFIVSDSGAARVWKNGDFVATTSVSGMRFPGQVRITSQPPPDSDDAGKSDRNEQSSDGAGDEDE